MYKNGDIAINEKTGERVVYNELNNSWEPQDALSRYTGGILTSSMGGSPALESVLQGATFGFSDELQAAAKTGFDKVKSFLTGDKSQESVYQQNVGDVRAPYNAYKEHHPYASFAGELAGGVVPAVGLLNSAMKTGYAALHPMATASGVGAATGAVSGAGYAPTMQDIPEYSASGAALGAVLPPAINYAGKAIGYPVKAAATSLSHLAESPTDTAYRMVGNAFKNDLSTPDELLQRMSILGKSGTLADTGGPNVRQLAQTVASYPGKSKALAEGLKDRGEQSSARLLRDLKAVTGVDKSAFEVAKNIVETRKAQSAPYYKGAYRELVQVDDELASLFNRPVMKRFYDQGIKKAASDLDWPSDIKIPSANDLQAGKTIPLAAIDWTKRNIDDAISVALKKGANDDARMFTALKNAILEKADKSVPDYATARGIYSGYSKANDALTLGQKAMNMSPEEISASLSNMSQTEKEMFMVGFTSGVSNKLKGTVEGGNAARRLATDIAKERVRAAFSDKKKYDDFIKGLERENIFAETKNAITGGSPTQIRDISAKTFANQANDIAGAASGDYSSMFLKILDRVMPKNEIPEPVRDEIGRILLSDLSKYNNVQARAIEKLKDYGVRQDQVRRIVQDFRSAVSVASGEQGASRKNNIKKLQQNNGDR